MLTTIKASLAQKIHAVVQELAPAAGIGIPDIEKNLELPKQIDHGHLAYPVFSLSKQLRQAPPAIAAQLSNKLAGHAEIEALNPVGGYVNIKFKSEYLQSVLLQSVSGDVSKLGFSRLGMGKTVVIDYSSPNIAKPMSIGHLRATVIGQAIRNLAETQGYKVIGINHLGDWGTQFGKLVHAYNSYGHEYDFKNDPFGSLFKIYVRFHEEAENNPELEAKGAECFKKLENGDPAIRKIWENFREISIKEYERLYDLLGVKFDLIQGEAFYNDKLDATVEKVKKAGILEESQGAQVVFVGEDKPPCIIRKSDGTSIYATRDLASAIYRHDVLKGDEILYVVGVDQTLHFQQVFEVLKKMGYDWAGNCHHIAFGMYRFKDMGKMSTRRGNVIFMEDVIDRAIEEVKEIIEQKNPNLADKQKVAEQVGVGAIVFNDLANDRIKNVDFDWKSVLDFEGDSGPYVQYCVVRCKSLERKLGRSIKLEMPTALNSDEEKTLMLMLMTYGETLSNAYRAYKPNIVATYLLALCRAFNHFYHKHSVLQEPDAKIQQSRLALTKATQIVLEKGLAVLGIQAPDQM